MAGVAIKTGVHQHCIQNVNNWLSIGLRHVRSDIKILRVFHILNGKRKRNIISEDRAFHIGRCAAFRHLQNTAPCAVLAES